MSQNEFFVGFRRVEGNPAKHFSPQHRRGAYGIFGSGGNFFGGTCGENCSPASARNRFELITASDNEVAFRKITRPDNEDSSSYEEAED
jgi:hypothetical protein